MRTLVFASLLIAGLGVSSQASACPSAHFGRSAIYINTNLSSCGGVRHVRPRGERYWYYGYKRRVLQRPAQVYVTPRRAAVRHERIIHRRVEYRQPRSCCVSSKDNVPEGFHVVHE